MPSNIRQFDLDLRRFTEREMPERAALFHRRATLEALRLIDQKSPVDTGRFRGNNQVTVGSPAASTLEREDPTGAAARAEAAAAVARLAPYSITYIANNLPYAIRLEEGHSQQAPNGVYAITLAELQTFFRDGR